MTLSSTIRELWESGRVSVGRAVPSAEELAEAEGVLIEYEAVSRQDLPGTPPGLSLPALRWSLARFHSACRFLVYRDFAAEDVEQEFAMICPELESPTDPAVHYTVDLLFRYLPDLVRLARAAAANDPLVIQLGRLANHWPLSTVGMEGVVPTSISGFADDPALLALYADRIIAREDVGRMGDPRVDAAVRQALGAFPELAPALAQKLSADTHEEQHA